MRGIDYLSLIFKVVSLPFMARLVLQDRPDNLTQPSPPPSHSRTGEQVFPVPGSQILEVMNAKTLLSRPRMPSLSPLGCPFAIRMQSSED
ncbi:hypothetical protein E2C01_076793 [Portunus trituberculatus]|uniref:Uncharacterized protein n=1 Tax=Portunus trituberculatus TaxID=210409 RepID=A0A5B7IKL2_PORTR|nr:hypothetical protein [Portunus trituberculatus]